MNYVLIFPDEMRAESLHCYGNPAAITPNMDALAAEGTRFNKNYTEHPVCTASRNALATGCYPHVHGFRSLKHYLGPEDDTFVKELREYGFETCFGGKSDCWNQAGTEDAFTDLDPALRWEFYDLHGLKKLYHSMLENPRPEILPHDYLMLKPPKPDAELEKNGDYQMVTWATERIAAHAHGGKPFFMWLSLSAPHPTYQTYEKYDALYHPDELPPQRDFSWLEKRPDLYKLIRQYRALGEEDESIFRKIYATYLGMITFVDDQVGRVVDALKENGIYDGTTVIICSDHGDFAGDAGLVEKWPSAVDDMLTRVPLIIRRPGCPGGHVVDTPTQSFDIFPTIFDYEGLAIRHPQFGVSLRAQVEGAPGDTERYVYCEGGYDTSEMHCFEGTPLFCMHLTPGAQYYPKMMQEQKDPDTVCRVVMQRDNRYKLIVRVNGQNELYDMDEDPCEYHNLYHEPGYRALRDERLGRMLTWLIHTSDVTPYKGHLLPEDE